MSAIVLDNTRPVARCCHLCDICGGIIPPGHQYHRQRGIYDGDPYVFKGHGLCVAADRQVRRDLDLDPEEAPDPSEVMPLVSAFFAALCSTPIPYVEDDHA